MQLPPVEAVPSLCEEYRITDERALLTRASTTYWERERRLDTGEIPRVSLADQAEWQAAEAIWIAVGLLKPVMQWPWRSLEILVGDILAGEVWVAGAKTGDGKSTFIANLIDALTTHTKGAARMTIATLEQSPATFKAKLACLALGYSVPAVFRQEWYLCGVSPEVGRQRIREEIARQAKPPLRENIRYCPADTLDREGLAKLIEQAHEWHHRLVIVDHIHHMDHGDGPENRGIRETMKMAKALAKRFDMGVLFTAQLNRGDNRDRRRKFYPPELTDLQGSSAVEQVADGILLLYRPLEDGIKVGDLDDVIMGQRDWKTVWKPNTLAVRCAKHRLDGDQRNKDALLRFEHGRIMDPAPALRVEREIGDAYEGEAA